MKILVLAIISAMALSCSNTQKLSNGCYKGRLEIKAICANYTIKLVDGNLDKDMIESSWTNESTKKTHTNVFSLENPCVIPADMKEGEEFYFTLVPSQDTSDCVTCMAYYPKPDKKLNIKILDQPCK